MDTLLTESMISGFSSLASTIGFYREASSGSFLLELRGISAKTVRSWCY
jgi:hypothetical protein